MKKLLNNFEECFLAILLPAMVSIVFLNTVGRYTGTFSLDWADEASRYLMIWLVFLGISAAAKRNAHFAVGVLFMVTPARLHLPIRAFILFMVLVFTGAAAVLGCQYAWRLYGMGQTSPALSLPMWFMYGSIPFGCFFMAIRSIQFFAGQVKAGRNPDFDDKPKFDPNDVEIG
ncbi:MAG: TRAP transporter small permease [Candidatus Adiutrix sp.]|jgi:TRAP-type C4-dicarboxylate transport system permease small subunit|nr:TRAP transporter small permease [Candidatus Adiutrix sp.]